MRIPGFVGAMLLCLCTDPAPASGAEPSVDHSPARVVEIVLEALQRSDATPEDRHLDTVFSFASPANRRVTGPIERFARMIRQGYPDMLSYIERRREPIEVRGDVALQAVWLTTPDGREVGYVFRLGRQQQGRYENMWMTDAVYPLGESRLGDSI